MTKPSTCGCTVVERRDFTVPMNSVVCSTGRSVEGHHLDRHGGPAAARWAGLLAAAAAGRGEGRGRKRKAKEADEATEIPVLVRVGAGLRGRVMVHVSWDPMKWGLGPEGPPFKRLRIQARVCSARHERRTRLLYGECVLDRRSVPCRPHLEVRVAWPFCQVLEAKDVPPLSRLG